MKKATSVQNIKNVKDICFTIENNPAELKSKLVIVASTNDDIFEFEFEGPDLLQSCKAAGLFTGWEKDQKIRELEKELDEWKKVASDYLKTGDEIRRQKNKEINKLKQQLQQAEHADMLDKEAADYWSKEHDTLSERFAKLQEENKQLKEEYRELEALKTPTIENFAVEEHYDQPKTDNVNHPSHYETGKFECIEVMQEVFGITAVCDFCKCNTFKYIYRMDRKNGDEDVRKAIWYLNKYLELSEKIVKDGGTDNGREKQIPEGE